VTFQGVLIIFRFSVCCFTSMYSVGVAPIYDIRTYNLWSMYLCINKSVISVINKSIIGPEQGDTFLFYAQLIRSQIFTTTTMMFSSFTHRVRPSAWTVMLLRSGTASTGILYLPIYLSQICFSSPSPGSSKDSNLHECCQKLARARAYQSHIIQTNTLKQSNLITSVRQKRSWRAWCYV
jgi:hypothetical protein